MTGANSVPMQDGARLGSKRKASGTGVDEFGDDGIDDTDFVLAGSGGFENIDDFDDAVEPAGVKRSRTTCVTAAPGSAQEPKHLENGKWACNHNCKDKTACKHLCCREGLDKKPKPPKPKTDKQQQDSVAGPKQTRLSMPASKEAKSSSLLLQSQKTSPVLSRVPPRRPEIENLHSLHDNIPSNTGSGSFPIHMHPKPIAPKVAPKPGLPRLKFSEAARLAEQDVYPDDFDSLDQLSFFDEPAAVQHKGYVSPLLLSQDDMAHSNGDDMLDSCSDADGNADFMRSPVATQGNQATSLHWRGSASPHRLDFVEQTLDTRSKTALKSSEISSKTLQRSVQSPKSSSGLFVQSSSSGAALGLDTLAPADQPLTLTDVPKDSRSRLAPSKSGVKPEALTAMDSAVLTTDGERPVSSDSATKLFMEELGFDLFNYIG